MPLPVRPLLAIALLGGCASELSEPLQSGRVMSLMGLQGRWVGDVAPVDSGCGHSTRGLMSVGSNGFAFDPFRSTAVIRGEVREGQFTGSLVRQGPDRQDLSITFDGAAGEPDVINGTLRSGRCRWTVVLHRG